MDDLTLKQYRGEILERFINIETHINAIISLHYLEAVSKRFLFDVLYDEYFSFALRRRILEKIIDDNGKRACEHLRRLNTIRNYFAHCNLEFSETLGGPTRRPDPKNTDQSLDFEQLYREFLEKEPVVLKYLESIFQIKGGQPLRI